MDEVNTLCNENFTRKPDCFRLFTAIDEDPGNLCAMALPSTAEDKYLMSSSVKLKESLSLLRSMGQKLQTSSCCCFVSHGHWFSCRLFKVVFGCISNTDTG